MPHNNLSRLVANLEITREEIKRRLEAASIEPKPDLIEEMVQRLYTVARDAAANELVRFIDQLKREKSGKRLTSHRNRTIGMLSGLSSWAFRFVKKHACLNTKAI